MTEQATAYVPAEGDRVRVTRYVLVYSTRARENVTVQTGVITEAVQAHDGWYITLDTAPDRIFTGYQFCGPGNPANGGPAEYVTEVELYDGEDAPASLFRQDMAPDYAVGLDEGDCVVIWVLNPRTGAVERTLTVSDVDELKDALDMARRSQRATLKSADAQRLEGVYGKDRAQRMRTRLGKPLNRAIAVNVLTSLGRQRGHAEAAIDRAQRYAGRLEPEHVDTAYAGRIRVAYEDGNWVLTEVSP